MTQLSLVVSVDGLRRSFGGRRALAGVDLTAGRGVTAVLGPNGAGKSTLVRILATADMPEDGNYEINGISALSRVGQRIARRQLGWLPQQFGYDPGSRVIDYLDYIGWLREIPKRNRPDEIRRALVRVGLEDRARSRLRTLSGGMIRRVGLAQATLGDPGLLLLDEPTAGLDPMQRQSLYQLIRSEAESRSVVLATHLTEDVDEVADHVVVLAAGVVVWSGSIEELRQLSEGRSLARTIVDLMSTGPISTGAMSPDAGGSETVQGKEIP